MSGLLSACGESFLFFVEDVLTIELLLQLLSRLVLQGWGSIERLCGHSWRGVRQPRLADYIWGIVKESNLTGTLGPECDRSRG